MATPHQFYDPFFTPTQPQAPTHPDGSDLPKRSRLLKGNNGTNGTNGSAGDIQPIRTVEDSKLPITGQGTIAISTSAGNLLRFSVATKGRKDGDATLHLEVGLKEILFYFNPPGKSGDTVRLEPSYTKGIEACYLNSAFDEPLGGTTYWLSIDKNLGYLRYGKYFTNKAMTLMEVHLKHLDEQSGSPNEGTWVWNDPALYSWISDLKEVEIKVDDDDPKTNSVKMKIQPLPIMMDLSPFIVSTDQVTLMDLETGKVTPPANLPDVCQALYANIAGKEIVLDDADFPDFSKAIQRSVITPGLWAYDKLEEKAKAGELGHDIHGTYLRITLGYNLGDSPGQPYVVEVVRTYPSYLESCTPWPSQHHSPIHDHGAACAVIKVLSGEITCTWYDSLGTTSLKPAELGPPGILSEGQITWISPENYQIHKLYNASDTLLLTGMIRTYEKNNHIHEDVFNWRDDTGETKAFNPNSDKAYSDFRRIMQKEWYEYKAECARKGF